MRLRLKLDRLNQIITASRVSQNHWAMRLGLSRGHWSDILGGRHPFPSAKTRQRLVEVLGVDERELFEPVSSPRDAEFDFRLAIAARFELTSELGQGGMGTVYLANDLALGRVVALKMVAVEAVAGVGASQLLQEIALVSRLQHPNILPLFDAGERAGSPFYVMPWVRSGSLGGVLRKRTRLPLGEALSLLDGIAAGLGHAHEHHVLHCDIKPENILVEGSHAWMMDFGIARKLHTEAFEWMSLRKELDFSAGTPAYVSPEQASGEPNLDQRSDVYSLACVAYEMITGRKPFAGETTQQIVTRRFHESPPPLQRYAPDVPAAVAATIERAMAIEPGLRPASANAFAAEMRAASGAATPLRTAISVGGSRALRRLRTATLGEVPSKTRRNPVREWVTTLRQDLVYAVRQRRRSAGLALMAIVTLALSIGLTTAVFAVVDGVLLRPLPFPDAGQLVALRSMDSTGSAFSRASSANWSDWKKENRSLEASALLQEGRVSVAWDRGGSDAVRASGQSVTADFFQVLRARFVEGRGFQQTDVESRAPFAIVSEAFWAARLGRTRVDSLTIRINGFNYTVVGVVAGRHTWPQGSEVFLLERPRTFGGAERNNVNYRAIARLKPAVSIEEAGQDLSAIARRIHAEEPVALYSYGVGVRSLIEDEVGDNTGMLTLLLAAVGLVLLIACANLASANLAQSAARSREMAVRTALGAGRGRLVRQALVDHLMIALVGGALGVGLAYALITSSVVVGAAELPRADAIGIDGRVLAVALLLSAFAGVATGLVPALRASQVAPVQAMEGGSRGHVVGGRGLPGRVFVAAEIAMALMLIVGAGLLVQSMRAVLARQLGFDTDQVVVAEISLGGPRYSRDSVAMLSYWERLRQSLGEIPGNEGAALANWVPLVRGGNGFIEIAGKDLPGAGAGYRAVSEGYFETLGIRLLQGRSFAGSDRADGARITVISRKMAERYWPGESPLGQQVRATSMEAFGQGAPWLTIVGVVSDARPGGQEREETAEMYVLYRQLPPWRISHMSALVKASGSESSIMNAVRERVRSVDPMVPADVTFLRTHANRVTASRRFTMATLSIFGVLSLLLAAIGVYGVLSFASAQRTGEMAVRAALGADRGRLWRLMLGSGVRIVGAGLVVGLAGALSLSGLAQSLLFDVGPRDPVVFLGATLTIAIVGLLAAAVPALRASRVEPMDALRAQ
jgi:putative ABC transport system permease protein